MIALSIDFNQRQSNREIHQTMDYLSSLIGTDIYYSIEHKKTNNQPHIHGILDANQNIVKKLLSLYLSNNWHISTVHDANGWISYCIKESKQINTTHSNQIRMISTPKQTNNPNGKAIRL